MVDVHQSVSKYTYVTGSSNCSVLDPTLKKELIWFPQKTFLWLKSLPVPVVWTLQKNQVRPAIVIGTLKMLPWCKSSSSQQGACFSRGIMPENAYLCMRGRYLCRNNVCCSICCKTIFSSKLLYSNPNDSEPPWDCGAEVFLLHTALSSVRPQIKRSQSKEDYKNTG